MITGFSHIGHAVENMDKTLHEYRQLMDIGAAHVLKILPGSENVSFLPIMDNVIMVVEPNGGDGFAGKHIKQNGEGLYCYALISDDLQQDLAALKQVGIRMTEAESNPQVPFKTAWFDLHGALIELISEDMHRWIWQKCQRGKGRARLSHVGHAVRNIKTGEDAYAKLFGIRRAFYLDLIDEGVLSSMMPVATNFLELLEPTDDNGPIAKFLNGRGEGLYHCAIVAEDVEKEIGVLKSRGAKIIELPPTVGLPFKTAWIRIGGLSYEFAGENLMAHLIAMGKKGLRLRDSHSRIEPPPSSFLG